MPSHPGGQSSGAVGRGPKARQCQRKMPYPRDSLASGCKPQHGPKRGGKVWAQAMTGARWVLSHRAAAFLLGCSPRNGRQERRCEGRVRSGSSQALSAAPNPVGKDVPQQWAREVLLPTLEPLWALTSGAQEPPRNCSRSFMSVFVCVDLGSSLRAFPDPQSSPPRLGTHCR